MRVINECRVDFQYRLYPVGPLISKTNFSNVVSTDIIKDILKVKKFVDKKFTYVFDILTYTIVVFNMSNFTAENIFFKDKIPNSTKFIENSIEINGLKRKGISPDIGFYIQKIYSKCSVTVTFRVLVLPQCFAEPIKNFSTIIQKHIINIEEPPITLKINSNNVISKFENRIFKNVVINKILTLKKDVIKIRRFKVKSRIVDIKIADEPLNKIYKNNVNTTILIAIGIVEYKIYIHFKSRKKVINYSFGFSSFIEVPIGIMLLDEKKINIEVKDSEVMLIDKRNIFFNLNILLYF